MSQSALTLPEALNRAVSDYKAGKLVEAEQRCEQIVAAKPDFSDALYVLAVVQLRQGKNDAALASFDRTLALQPSYAMAHFNRGNVLQTLKRYEEAVASYDRAINFRPNFAIAHSNRGNVLQTLKRYEEAVASYDRALALQPSYAVALYNRGLALHELRRCEEAVASYERAIAVRPGFAEAHLNQSLSRLIIGDFGRGWQEYEWRMDVKSPGNSKRSFARPQWQGHENISGKTILLHAEQGFGDTIQFCRYVPLVAARGARVILEVPMPLVELMTTVTGASQILCKGDPLPDFDIQCPLPSLPLAFGTRLATIPSAVPYLRASSQGAMNWDTRLGPKRRPRIGLAWSGELTHPNDQNRSIPLSSLLSLLDIDATFVSLQKDVRAKDAKVLQARSDLRHFGDDLKNFADTAALISHLDLVISIDSSVAHLAGALAKPVWVLLPFNSDWRWLLDRDDNPWYPTVRLFRQDDLHARDWDNVIARIHAALREFMQNRL
jgi:Tfp pilus assembly protein PilF